jgi:poly-beta-hydroxyalkanoate depolymerase
MLYNTYEMQRNWLAGASAMAALSAELLQSPANPFASMGGSVMGSALEVFAHASAPLSTAGKWPFTKKSCFKDRSVSSSGS